MPSTDVQEQAAWLHLATCGLPADVAQALAARWLAGGRPLAALASAGDAELAALDLPVRRLARLRAAAPIEPDLLAECAAAELVWLPVTDARYPARLRAVAGWAPPPLLTLRGEPALLSRPAAALVGNRRASAAGLAWAHELAERLTQLGVHVLSGNARGIDRAAHAGAAAGGGPTTAVLPEGLLRWTGNDHLTAAVSPFHPRQVVTKHTPLARNEVVAALAGVLVVAETRPSGGTWHVATTALRFGRPVLVRPDGAESGAPHLLRAGARALSLDLDEAVVAVLAALHAPERAVADEQLGLPGTA